MDGVTRDADGIYLDNQDVDDATDSRAQWDKNHDFHQLYHARSDPFNVEEIESK